VLVGERMSSPVITIQPDMPMPDALDLMHQERVRRFPVVERQGKLVGIVSERDLLHASPSDATSLSIWEINYLLTKIVVGDIMTRDVITIKEDTPLEEAARIMTDNKIGGLPILRGDNLVGIITETDLFKIFLELLGAREPGVRLTTLVPNVPGELATLTKVVFDIGGSIVALGTFSGESSENREVCMKVADVVATDLAEAIEPLVEKIIDIREPQVI
jgi:acetoin utilization protein AcuB